MKQKQSGGTPLDTGAKLCVYLASDCSDGITGKLISAVWDPWQDFDKYRDDLATDIYTLRRIVLPNAGRAGGKVLRAAIVGCGLIGQKRAGALAGGSVCVVL